MYTTNKLVSSLRLLALTAPSYESALPEIFKLISHAVGSKFLGMFWHDTNYMVTDVVSRDSVPISCFQDFFDNFMPNESLWRMTGFYPRDIYTSFDRSIQTSASPQFDMNALLRSDFNDRVLKEICFVRVSGVICRDTAGTPIGGIGIGRSANDKDYSKAEMHALDMMQPWLEHLIRKDNKISEDAAGHLISRQATIITGIGGEIISMTQHANQLLCEIDGIGLHHIATSHKRGSTSASVLKKVRESVIECARGKDTPPPCVKVKNKWGLFNIRGYLLTPAVASTPETVMIQIEKQSPLSVMLFNSLGFLRLSDREKRVALGVIQKKSGTSIASELGIAPSTALYYTKEVYTKLGVSSLEALRKKLIDDMSSQ